MIAIGLSPNTQKKDYLTALAILFSPSQWVKRKYIKKLEDWFKKYYKVPYAISFDSGRSGELAILRALDVGRGDEVLIQAFTCVAVPNSIISTGAKPVYVDIDKETLNIDIEDLERKITKKSKSIIIQHTFGIVRDVREIREIAKKHKLFLIEDCAHSLGAPISSDVAFFSFGRDKVISSVFGGMVISRDRGIGERVKEFQERLSYPSVFWVIQQLLHPLLFSIILPTYNFFNLGKIILFLAQKLHLLSFPNPPRFYPRKMPNALAKLATVQLARLENFNKNRKTIAQIYAKELNTKIDGDKNIFLRFPMLVDKQRELLAFAKKRGILLGDWYSNIVDPKNTNLKKVGYIPGSCPVAEEIASKIINLPTYPRMTRQDVDKVISVVKNFYAKH